MTPLTKTIAILGITLGAGSHAAFAGENKAADRACDETAMAAAAKTESVAAAKSETVAEGETAPAAAVAAATVAAADSSAQDSSAPRDAASGLPTGKRQHKPVNTTACDDDAEASKDMVLKGKKIQEN